MAPQVTVKANSDPYHNCLVLKCNHITINHLEQTGGSGWIIVSYHNLLYGTPVHCACWQPWPHPPIQPCDYMTGRQSFWWWKGKEKQNTHLEGTWKENNCDKLAVMFVISHQAIITRNLTQTHAIFVYLHYFHFKCFLSEHRSVLVCLSWLCIQPQRWKNW